MTAMSRRALPPPLFDRWSWQLQGSCRNHPSEMFFPEEDRGQRLRRTEEEAKRICRGCPVVNRCLEHALAAPETHGIWGATTPVERCRMIAI